MAAEAAADTHAQPLHVALFNPSSMMQVYLAVRVLGVTALVLVFMRVGMEEHGVTRGMGTRT